MADPSPKVDIGKALIKGIRVHYSLEQEVVVTTCDKFRLCLVRHQNLLSARTSWIAPLGLLLTFVTALIAADFKDVLLSPENWKIAFSVGVGASGLWLLWTLYHSGRSLWVGLKKGLEGTIDDIVNELKVKIPEVVSSAAVIQQAQVQPTQATTTPAPPTTP
jgi:hypothetical protein